jgi:hypothetical protein
VVIHRHLDGFALLVGRCASRFLVSLSLNLKKPVLMIDYYPRRIVWDVNGKNSFSIHLTALQRKHANRKIVIAHPTVGHSFAINTLAVEGVHLRIVIRRLRVKQNFA